MPPPAHNANATIGFEVEFDTTRMSPETYLAIKIRNESGDEHYLTPDEYLENIEQLPHGLSSMYDAQLVLCHQLDKLGKRKDEEAFIDAAFDSAVTASTGIKQYLPEFRTEPFSTKSLDELKNVSDFYEIINHYISYIKASKTQTIEIKSWVATIRSHATTQADWLSTRYYFSADILAPKAPYQAAVVLKVPVPELFNPILAIHVNVAVPLRKLYSTDMLNAFPHEEHYPEKVAITPEWASCKIPPVHVVFAKKLITDIERSVLEHLRNTLPKGTRLLQSQNIAGVLRTLIYCYSMQTYIASDLCKAHFPESVYSHEQSKDFYLFGLPKFNLGTLVDKLSPEEKSLLFSACFPEKTAYLPFFYTTEKKYDTSALNQLFIDALSNIHTDRAPIPNFYDLEKEDLVSYTVPKFIHATLLTSLLNKPRNNLSLVIKVLEPLVIEFRSAIGHGCTVDRLPTVLERHFNAARILDLKEADLEHKFLETKESPLSPTSKKYLLRKRRTEFSDPTPTLSPARRTTRAIKRSRNPIDDIMPTMKRGFSPKSLADTTSVAKPSDLGAFSPGRYKREEKPSYRTKRKGPGAS